MERKMNGRELRNALLSIAQRTRDDEEKSLQNWLDEIHGFILGTSDGILAQKDIVKTVSDMVEEPKTLQDLSGAIGNWSPAAIAKAVREYGAEHGLFLSRNSVGRWQVAKAC